MEKRVRFEIPEGEEDANEEKEQEQPEKMKKHSLDSDEEDEADNQDDANLLNEEEFYGMESGSVKYDGDIQITPFNLEEELETGHFDKAGNYIFQKESGDDQDNWLADIDWSKVKEKEQAGTSKNGNKDSDEEDANDSQDGVSSKAEEANLEITYKRIIELLLPGESIQKAIQRFGKNCPKVQRGNNKRKAQQNNDNAKDPEKLKAKEDLHKLSSLADDILRTGDMDVYEKTYEQINLELTKISKLSAKNVSAEDDMFGDGFDVNT